MIPRGTVEGGLGGHSREEEEENKRGGGALLKPDLLESPGIIQVKRKSPTGLHQTQLHVGKKIAFLYISFNPVLSCDRSKWT